MPHITQEPMVQISCRKSLFRSARTSCRTFHTSVRPRVPSATIFLLLHLLLILLPLLFLLLRPSVCPSNRLLLLGRPFANDHLDFFLSTRFFSIFLIIFSIFLFPPMDIIFAFKIFLLQILGSGFNLADLSRTMSSCSNAFLTKHFLSDLRLICKVHSTSANKISLDEMKRSQIPSKALHQTIQTRREY